jgi:hypothetical protein
MSARYEVYLYTWAGAQEGITQANPTSAAFGDHAVIGPGLRLVLDRAKQIQVVAEAGEAV